MRDEVNCEWDERRRVTRADAERVTRYYDEMQRFYGRFWNRRRVRYGLWFDGTRSHVQSLEQSDKLIAEKLSPNQGDKVLDAGCGVGATASFLSQWYGVRTTGISVSTDQLRRARNFLEDDDLDRPPNFLQADFLEMPFRSESFHGVVGVESICYAREKADFLEEAFRVLRPGGRLVVLDGFRGREPKTKRETRSWERFLSGLSLTQLDSVSEFSSKLKAVGFEHVESIDLTQNVLPSARRISWLSWMGAIPAYLPVKVGLLPEMWLDHALAGVDNRILFERRIEEYAALVATKPAAVGL